MSTAASPVLCPPPDPNPRRPRRPLPPGTVDCHCHLFEDPARYPMYAGRSYTPPPATRADYLRLMDTLGIGRTVQVNASVYGTDNTVTLDFIRDLGQHRARGVAGLAPDADARTLERLHEGGFRGVRLSTRVKGYGGPELLGQMGAKVRPFGWHVQLHVDTSAELAPLEDALMRHPTPIVFDHLGRTPGRDGVDAPGFQALLRILARREDAWVKLSSWYRLSSEPGPRYADMAPLARALIATRPDRCVWGTNWPHPTWEGRMPNDGDLVDELCEWAGDDATLTRILVDNPAQLYFS